MNKGWRGPSQFQAAASWNAISIRAGTTGCNRTRDILHVKQLLGHRNINSTLAYTQMVSFEGDEYHSATAKTAEEAKKLVEEGFKFILTTLESVMVFRKRK